MRRCLGPRQRRAVETLEDGAQARGLAAHIGHMAQEVWMVGGQRMGARATTPHLVTQELLQFDRPTAHATSGRGSRAECRPGVGDGRMQRDEAARTLSLSQSNDARPSSNRSRVTLVGMGGCADASHLRPAGTRKQRAFEGSAGREM